MVTVLLTRLPVSIMTFHNGVREVLRDPALGLVLTARAARKWWSAVRWTSSLG